MVQFVMLAALILGSQRTANHAALFRTGSLGQVDLGMIYEFVLSVLSLITQLVVRAIAIGC